MKTSMLKGNIFKQILVFAIPLYIGNMFQQFYSTVDTIIVSRTLGVSAMSAVGATTSFSFLIIGFGQGATIGLSVLTAQFFGAGEMKKVKESVATSIVVSVGITVIMTVISVLFCRPILELMQTPNDIIDMSYSYLIVIFAGFGCSMIYNLCASMLRALGDSKRPLIILVIASVTNIILDFVFILYLGMGVPGAAYATIISQFFSGVCCFVYIAKKVPELAISKEDFKAVDKVMIKSHLGSAMPMGMQFSIIAIGVIIIQFALNGLGTDYVAAYTAASKIEILFAQAYPSLGAAVVTFVAQNYGAGNIQRIKEGAKASMQMVYVYTAISAMILIFLGTSITKIFVGGGHDELYANAQMYLTACACAYIFLGMIFVYRNALQGIGNSRATLTAGVLELVARSSVIFILAIPFGYQGVVLATPITWVVTALYLVYEYRKSMKKIDI